MLAERRRGGTGQKEVSLAMRQRPTVGVLLPYGGGFYFTSLLGGIHRAARERGARVVAFQTAGLNLAWSAEPETLPLAWQRIDGWIGINDQQGTAHYERIAAAGKPLVTVSTRLVGHGCCAVLPDNHDGVGQAVRHLLSHGHRRIAFVGPLGQLDVRERHDAYIATLREAGIVPDPSLTFPTASSLEVEGREAGKQLVAARLPCTAVMAGTDLNALGVIHQVQAAGYRVPEDLAVVGFDGIEETQYTNPAVTTIDMPFDVVAQKAAEVLLGTMLDGAAPVDIIRVRGTLIRRPSCGCTRRRGRGALAAPSTDASPREVDDRVTLTAALIELVAAGRSLGPILSSELNAGAAKIAAHVGALVRGEPGIASDELHDVWLKLLSVTREVETVDSLLSLLEETATTWFDRAPAPAPHTMHFCMRNLRFELMRAWRTVEQTRRRYADAMSQANRRINLALIGAEPGTAQELSWFRWAFVRHAALGEWKPATATSPRRLRIRSAFQSAADETLGIVGAEHAPGDFPSAEICSLLDEPGQNNILSVVPITGRGQNRGLMTVVAPVEAELTDDTGNLAQWAALLSAAMDREELLGSLRTAVDRERDFVETLRRSEERYALAAHGANDGLWDWDVASGRVYFSARWKSMLGYEEHEIGSDIEAWFARVLDEDLPRLKETLHAHLGERKTHIEHEYRMVHRDGRQVWTLCRGIVLFDAHGRAVRAAGSQTDISGRREVEEQLRRSALHDGLTGLANRALLVDRLEQAIARSQRTDRGRFAVMFLDLDHFKTLNDSLGHLAGDQLLIQIAQRLGDCLRSIDTVARFGGDEFAIIVTELETDETATRIAEGIHDALRAPFDIDGHRVFTSASIGIAMSSERHDRAEDYLRDADTAMYRAKAQGRASHQLFDGRMHEQAMERLSVEAGVRRALERDEFVLYYQPIVMLHSDEVAGVEALIRWRHPERGILGPAAFLHIADESGLILKMSEWVIRTACEQARQWKTALRTAMRVSVNIPSQQLKDPHFIDLIEGNLSRAGIDAASLGLELVESSLIEHSSTIVENLRRLRQMGIYIAVDDFGTGYSSLSYLKRLPIEALKIDRSFTQGIPDDPNDTAISTTIIAMARSLGLNVVAEGVETVEQAEFLRRRGCHMAQGYYFSHPMPGEDCLPFFEKAREGKLGYVGPLSTPLPRASGS
jgi:diguanylate cyclase (GGDEF)-like protein/PAS domain S-box-containing protein